MSSSPRKLRVVKMWLRLIPILMVVSCSKGSEPPRREPPHGESPDEQRLLRACDGGANGACDELQRLYLQSRRRAESSALVQRLCERGRQYFCPTYAFVLDLGDGLPRDRTRARQLFEDTCKHDPTACSEFGSLYLAGTATVAQDIELGCFLAEKACALGDQDACRDRQACARAD